MYEFTHSSTHLQSIFPSQCPMVELDPTARYGACATLTEPVCKPLNMLFTSWEHIASFDFESLWLVIHCLMKVLHLCNFWSNPQVRPYCLPYCRSRIAGSFNGFEVDFVYKSKQDHRRWRYHRRLLDSQSPFISFRSSNTWDHQIPLDH